MRDRIEELNKLPLDEFTGEIQRLIGESTSCFEDSLLSEALEFFAQGTGIEYNYMLFAMAESEIKKAVANGAQKAQISELLEECICAERRFYELLYKPEAFEEKAIKWLPGECQYNDILVRFLVGGKKQVRMILDAARLRPDMAQVLKCWIGA